MGAQKKMPYLHKLVFPTLKNRKVEKEKLLAQRKTWLIENDAA
jgi:hypothetical protein